MPYYHHKYFHYKDKDNRVIFIMGILYTGNYLCIYWNEVQVFVRVMVTGLTINKTHHVLANTSYDHPATREATPKTMGLLPDT